MGRGLYIHIPFCDKKCSYCDFLSGTYTSDFVDDYLNLMAKEAALLKSEFGQLEISTVFIGGGTPTILSKQQILVLGELIHKYFDLRHCLEFTFEANPESVTLEKAEAFKTIGANRVSVGLQTADDKLLKVIDRIHDFNKFESCWGILEQVGFRSKNIDVMIGLPGQTEESYKASLLKILSFNPEHLSAYGLILEEGTPMEREVSQGRLKLPDEALERQLYHWTVQVLKQQGYEQYEISNFSKPLHACQHNLGYWKGEECAALGMGAHGFLEWQRYGNCETFESYKERILKKQLPWETIEKITQDTLIKEFIMLRLRLTEGINIHELESTFHVNFTELFGDVVKWGKENAWLNCSDSHCYLTNDGMDFCNQVIVAFYDCLENQ